MSIKEDAWIREIAEKKKMIEPFVPSQVKVNEKGDKIVSFGLSSYGYDLRVSNEFKVFTNVYNSVVDPKNFTEDAFVDICSHECIIPPNSFALARSVEYFRVPRDILIFCIGKSTYARCGIIVNVTPFEPEWEGHVTIEISNTTPLPARIYANEGIAQAIFFEAKNPCLVSYAERKGKYQKQTGITCPIV
jgi:dCTP deaminase